MATEMELRRKREKLLMPHKEDPDNITLVNAVEGYRRIRDYIKERHQRKAEKLEEEVNRLEQELVSIEKIRELKKRREELKNQIEHY